MQVNILDAEALNGGRGIFKAPEREKQDLAQYCPITEHQLGILQGRAP